LGMPNSTVSAKVSLLEKRLGVTLLQRTTRKLQLTQNGEAYFRRCVQALEELQVAENELANAQREPQGLLRLTAPVDIGRTLLPSLVSRFRKKYPQMGVDLRVTNRVLDLVAEGIDLAVRAGKLKDSRLIAKRFALGYFGLWASSDYLKQHAAPSHPRELGQHECVKFSLFKDDGFELTNGKERVRSAVSGRLLADDFEVVKSLAVLGEGIAFLPSFFCAEEAGENKLVRVLPGWRGDTVTVSLVYPKQRFVPPKVRAFIRVAEEMLTSKNG
jgi:DNA-binding transcriptional LysR family regulator